MLRLLKKPQIKQLTKQWYKIRHNLITASECSSALEANPFQKKIDLLKKKCVPIQNDTNLNPAIYWGKKYEHVAFNFYQKIKNVKCYDLGLLIHDNYKWLGASPDGISDKNILLEIKCLYNRELRNEVPYYYWIQTQIQMEVCDIDYCDFIQVVFREHKNEQNMKKYLTNNKSISFGKNTYQDIDFYWSIDDYNIISVKRDKEWFKNNVKKLKLFYDDIMFYRQNQSELFNRRKRKLYLDNKDNNKRTRYKSYITHNWSKWIAASEIYNCLSGNELIDWLNLYGEKNGFKKDIIDNKYNFNNYIKNKGIEFEENILKNLERKFGKDIIRIANSYEGYSIEKYKKTKEAMKSGIPIIYCGILHNKINKTFGIPNLIVRSDYINKIISNDIYPPTEVIKPSIFSDKWHYVIVEIKYHTLNLHTNRYLDIPENLIQNNTIKNNESIINYKGQIYIYNKALEEIQKYKPLASFILGRTVKKNKDKFNCFYMLGSIDYKKFDKNIGQKVRKALKLYKKIKSSKLGINDISVNMKSKNFDCWKTAIKTIAKKRKDISLVWNLSKKDCEQLRNKGINQYNNINLNLLDKSPKIINIMSKIIQQNTSKSNKFYPRKYNKNQLPDNLKIKKYKHELFIDFETVNSLDVQINNELLETDSSLIYMIGIIVKTHKGKCKYINLTVNRLTYNEEKIILLELDEILHKYRNSIVYHWSNAEVHLLENACKRHNLDIKMNNYDLLKLYKEIPITIKGCFSFGLKDVSKALYRNRFIKTQYEDSTLNGLDAMLVAFIAEKECSKNKIENISDMNKMKDIIKYNFVDCKLLLDLLNFVRNNIFIK